LVTVHVVPNAGRTLKMADKANSTAPRNTLIESFITSSS
jgi:hypothetical protein